MIYQYRPGFRGNVGAQVAGERLAELAEANGGHLTPAGVVEDSRDDDAPLHPCFEWRDDVAAELHRQDEARQLIRNVYRVEADAKGVEAPVLHHVHVTLDDLGPCYVTTARAMGDDELREQVEADALKAFQALRERYRHIKALAPIFAAIDAAEAKRKPARRRAEAVAAQV
jgi:hypothetical protein